MTPGQKAYEADVGRRPRYHTGELRKTWHQLDDIAKWSWERGEVDPARLASPGPVSHGSAGPARTPGNHVKRGDNGQS